MSISFVIPAHNAENVIENCLNTVFETAKSIPGAEIIVVENASHDATAAISRSVGAELLQTNIPSRSKARNLGWKKASNPWIAFIDADTELDAKWASAILEICDVKGCGGGQGPIIPLPCQPLSLSDFRMSSARQRTRGSFNSLHIVAFETPMINTAACLYRKSALEAVGGFDESLSRHEDIDLSRRISDAGWGFRAAPEAKAYVNWHGSGWKGYLARAIEVGRTKNEYNAKWFPYKSAKLEFRILLNDFRRLFRNLNRYREEHEFYFAQKFLVDSLQEIGKLLFFSDYWNLERKYKREYFDHMFSGRNGYSLKSFLRIIDLSDNVNLLNLKTNQVSILDKITSDIILRFVSWKAGEITSEEIEYLLQLNLISGKHT